MKFSFGIFFSLGLVSITNALSTTLTEQAACPVNVRSCTRNTGGSCCSPAYGLVVLAQQWHEGLKPLDAFTLHGLWPDYCNGTQTGNFGCDRKRNYPNVEGILKRNQTLYNEAKMYWPSYKKGPNPNDKFWTYEWKKHGTCVTTLNPKCYANYQPGQDVRDYFTTVLQLREKYNLYHKLEQEGIVPRDAPYQKTQVESAIHRAFGVTPQLTCNRTRLDNRTRLEEIRLHFYVENGNQYIHTDSPPFMTTEDKNDCPAELYYLPK